MHPDITPANLVLTGRDQWQVVDNELLTAGGLPLFDVCNAAYALGPKAGRELATTYLAQTRRRLSNEDVSILNCCWFARRLGSEFVAGNLEKADRLLSCYRSKQSILPSNSTLMYLACEWFNLPAFTYHPATNRVGWWWEAGRSGQGPAMYWYGWSALTLVVGLIAGLLGTLLPESVVKRIPLFLVWLLPLLVFIPLTYSLMPFWTK